MMVTVRLWECVGVLPSTKRGGAAAECVVLATVATSTIMAGRDHITTHD